MKIVVLGGYGVFGGRLARLLLRDGHSVWVTGRNINKAEEFTRLHGGRPLKVDLAKDLGPLLRAKPEAMVDAAGPFHAYTNDPYRVARFCIMHGIHYLDLSDDPEFTQGIATLDLLARTAGVFVISGASSVPGMSSSVVSALSEELTSIDVIETAIMPGNNAPRGRAVIAGILAQTGQLMDVWRGGRWRRMRVWSDPKTYDFGNGMRRHTRLMAVPDIALFPAFFGARSVIFRAGLELPLLNACLSALAWLRRTMSFRPNRAVQGLARAAAALVAPMGSDKGAMVVTVTGLAGDQTVMRRWQLIAGAGDGPFIPAVIARALLGRAGQVAPGARPCLAEIDLALAEAAMADLEVETDISETPDVPLFQAVLGSKWDALQPAVRRSHEVRDMESFSGHATIERGTGVIARAAAWLFGFPGAGADVPLTVTKTRTGNGETWRRTFDRQIFQSRITPAGADHVTEKFGPFTFELNLTIADGALTMPVKRGWFLGLRIPSSLLPVSDAREYDEDGRFHFDVALTAPLFGGLIVHYRGSLVRDAAESPEFAERNAA